MSDLTQFRDHARFMAGREHAPGCPPVRSKPDRARYSTDRKWCGEKQAHEAHPWEQPSSFTTVTFEWQCAGICGGCNPAEHRALWTRLADEIDTYLSAEVVAEDLFGETTTEPALSERREVGA